MNDVVGFFGHDNQGIFMGVVHPVCVCLNEDNVSSLLYYALCGVYTCSVHHNLGWMPRFMGVSIMHIAATPSLIGPPKDGKDLTFAEYVFGTFLGSDRTLLVRVKTLG